VVVRALPLSLLEVERTCFLHVLSIFQMCFRRTCVRQYGSLLWLRNSKFSIFCRLLNSPAARAGWRAEFEQKVWRECRNREKLGRDYPYGPSCLPYREETMTVLQSTSSADTTIPSKMSSGNNLSFITPAPCYSADSMVCFVNTYPLNSDLSGGQRYPAFEQLGPETFLSDNLPTIFGGEISFPST